MSAMVAREQLSSADLQGITALLHEYAWCVDDKSFDRLRRLFADDIEVVFGAGEPIRGADAVIAFMRDRTAALVSSQHAVTAVVVEDEGEQAVVRSSAMVSMVSDQEGGGLLTQRGAQYMDVVRRTEAGWVFARRAQRVLWTEHRPCELP